MEMMTRYCSKGIIFILTVLTCVLNSCIGSDSYSIPPLRCVDNLPATNGSLSELSAYKKVDPKESDIIGEDYVLEAYVSSSDETGNIYKTIFVQDDYENPKVAAGISVDATNLYADFPVGSKVKINLKGLVVQEQNNNIKIGSYDPSFTSVGRINPNHIGRYISRVCDSNAKNIVENTKALEFNSIGEALKNDTNINKLVKINNVQFESNELTKNFAEASGVADRIITDKRGYRLTLRNSGFSSFSNTPISPNYSGVGSVTLILTRYTNKSNQITEQGYIRSLNDLDFSSDPNTRFPVGVPEEPSTSAVNLFNGSDFEDWEAFKNSLNSYGIQSYAIQGIGTGRNGGNALHINGTVPNQNQTIFTVLKKTEIPKNPKKITFYMKGNVTGRSLSVNIFRENSNQYYAFNLGKFESQALINPTTSNSYTGSIDTKGEWILVHLNLENININTKEDDRIFALRVGSNAVCDILIDDIKIE